MLEVVMIKYETEEVDPNLKSWTLDSIDGSGINLSLEFDKVLEVSQGD